MIDCKQSLLKKHVFNVIFFLINHYLKIDLAFIIESFYHFRI